MILVSNDKTRAIHFKLWYQIPHQSELEVLPVSRLPSRHRVKRCWTGRRKTRRHVGKVQSQAKNSGFFIYTVSQLWRCSVENRLKVAATTVTLHQCSVAALLATPPNTNDLPDLLVHLNDNKNKQQQVVLHNRINVGLFTYKPCRFLQQIQNTR